MQRSRWQSRERSLSLSLSLSYESLRKRAHSYAKTRRRASTLAREVAEEAVEEWAIQCLCGRRPNNDEAWVNKLIRAKLARRAKEQDLLMRHAEAVLARRLDTTEPEDGDAPAFDPGQEREALLALLDLDMLTEREEQIVRALLELGSYKAVARKLAISVPYVKLVVRRAAAKLRLLVAE